MSNDVNLIMKMRQDYETVKQSQSGESFSRLSMTLEQIDEGLREYIQKFTLQDMKGVLEKLKKGQDLAAKDLEQIKLWIIGDAEYYTKMENSYDGWNNELTRIIKAINELWPDQADIETLLKLRGLVRDGIRTIADIFYFVQQKERVEKFTESTENIDEDERLLLVNLLEQKIKSSHF